MSERTTSPRDPSVEDAPYIDAELPPWAARATGYFVLLLFVLLVGGALLVQLPETVPADFVLAPVERVDPVRAIRGGVTTSALAAEGQHVRRGDTLLMLRSEALGERAAELQRLRASMTSSLLQLANAEQIDRNQQRVAEDERLRLENSVASYERTLSGLRRQLALARDLAARYHAAPPDTWTKQEIDARDAAADQLAERVEAEERARAAALSGLEKLRHEAVVRDAERLQLMQKLKDERRTDSLRVVNMEREAVYATGDALALVAPCDGTVLRRRVQGSGALLVEGDVVAEIACTKQPLQAVLALPEEGIALLHVGQTVRLRYDALPYQRYGVRFARLRWIGPAGQDSTSFRAFAELGDADPFSGRLMPGMGGRAEILIGSRTLASFVFDPIRGVQQRLAPPPD